MGKNVGEIYSPGDFGLGKKHTGIKITNTDGRVEEYNDERDLPPRFIYPLPNRRQVINIHSYRLGRGAKITAQDEIFVKGKWIPDGLPTEELLKKHGITRRLKDQTVLRGT